MTKPLNDSSKLLKLNYNKDIETETRKIEYWNEE